LLAIIPLRDFTKLGKLSAKARFMPQENNGAEQKPYFIFTREDADEFVTAALDSDPSEPGPFVRLLVILLDHAQEPRLKDALHELIKAAYDHSIVHSIYLDEYIEAVRQKKDIVEETRTRWLARQQSDA
jgi:hypothetical protein